jgi:hypothetical protein
MDLDELQHALVTCIDDQLRPGRDRGDRLRACRDLQRLLAGPSLWVEGCRQTIDLEGGQEPSLEEHVAGVDQAIRSLRWVGV